MNVPFRHYGPDVARPSWYSLIYQMSQLPAATRKTAPDRLERFIVLGPAAPRSVDWLTFERRGVVSGPPRSRHYRSARWVITEAPFTLVSCEPIPSNQ